MFIDYTVIKCTSGNGGAGAVSFRRAKYVPKGGPDGGDGGKGGDIVFIADKHLHTLFDIRYKKNYFAENGRPGAVNQKTGKNGKDIHIKVPLGTMVRTEGSDVVVADLVEDEQAITALKGGQGGRGNVRFKSATHQTPRFAQPGKKGETETFVIELKLLADVGLVGLPNAGKSTLLSVVSSARPKIADYPFTTLEPNLGIVKCDRYRSFIMADIPGLIKGAAEGKGLGHQFLKHLERTKLLLLLIDCTEPNPKSVYDTLIGELHTFNLDLAEKPKLIIMSKSDLQNEKTKDNWLNIGAHLELSAVSNQGIERIIQHISKIIHEQN